MTWAAAPQAAAAKKSANTKKKRRDMPQQAGLNFYLPPNTHKHGLYMCVCIETYMRAYVANILQY